MPARWRCGKALASGEANPLILPSSLPPSLRQKRSKQLAAMRFVSVSSIGRTLSYAWCMVMSGEISSARRKYMSATLSPFITKSLERMSCAAGVVFHVCAAFSRDREGGGSSAKCSL